MSIQEAIDESSVDKANATERQDEWLSVGAVEKANSIVQLTRDLKIRKVLEIGAGTGALLARLDELGYAGEYYALEPSRPLYDHLAKKRRVTRLVESENATLAESALGRRTYDLAILSHVVEHVPAPAALINEALEVADYVLVEVPLEATPLGNLRAHVRRLLTGRPRTENKAGHVQFFGKPSVDSMVRWCGGEIVGSRLHVPWPQLEYARKRGSTLRRLYAGIVWAAPKVLGEHLWGRMYYGHYAVLIRRRRLDAPSGPRHELYHF